ncbi:hypothetical protein HK102_008082, partial [Quaeritorhiza haematococci]
QYDEYTLTSSKVVEEIRHFGIVGFLELGMGKYVCVVTDKVLVANFGFRSVWKITNVRIIPVQKNPFITLDEEEHEKLSLESLTNMMTSDQLFFSVDVDLTNARQRCYQCRVGTNGGHSLHSVEYFANLDERFFWNKHLLEPFLTPSTYCFIIPVICGFVGSATTMIDRTPLSIVLISRINRHRAGTRFRRRGVNPQGNAAIEVETETILVTPKSILSYQIIRGSVPLVWRNNTTVPSYRPQIILEEADTPQSVEAMRQHFEKMMRLYGRNVAVVDLLPPGRGEVGVLQAIYEKSVKVVAKDLMMASSVSQVGDDDEEEDWGTRAIATNTQTTEDRKDDQDESGVASDSTTSGTRTLLADPPLSYGNYSLFGWFGARNLVKNAMDKAETQGYFHASLSESGLMDSCVNVQSGIFRVNCLDCVDETHVAQYLITREILKKMLQDAGILASNRRDLDRTASAKLADLWVECGHAVSRQYTGTSFKYEHWIRAGLIASATAPVKNVYIFLSRFYLNSFQDTARQEDIDLFVGDIYKPLIQ